MIRRFVGSLAFVAALTAPQGSLAAQAIPADLPLEDFVQQVARLWASADVAALVELIPEADGLTLDAGGGLEAANSRHAAAALRALFAESETVGATPLRVTVSATDPPRGFGELVWTYTSRAVPGEQSRSVYVAVRRDDQVWRITELRLMP